MPDVRLKAPNSDYVAVVGSAIEAAQLRGQGYTDVVDEPAQSTPPEPQESEAGGTGTPPPDTSTSTDKPPVSSRNKPAK